MIKFWKAKEIGFVTVPGYVIKYDLNCPIRVKKLPRGAKEITETEFEKKYCYDRYVYELIWRTYQKHKVYNYSSYFIYLEKLCKYYKG